MTMSEMHLTAVKAERNDVDSRLVDLLEGGLRIIPAIATDPPHASVN